MTTRRGFGKIRKLPSGRVQASYITPDNMRRTAPGTFRIKAEAEAWLAAEQVKITAGSWREAEAAEEAAARKAAPLTVAEFANQWLIRRAAGGRMKPLKPRTIVLYRDHLDRLILPVLGEHPLASLERADVWAWYDGLGVDHRPQNAAVYGLLRTVFKDAVDRDLRDVSPVRIAGAGTAPARSRPLTLLSLDDAAKLTEMAAQLPARLALMPQIAFWCGLRYGETTELRRKDVDLDTGMMRVERAVSWIRQTGQPGYFSVGSPKSDAGQRDVIIPPHLLPAVKAHFAEHARFGGAEALMFHGGAGPDCHVPQPSWSRPWGKIAKAAGFPGLTFHDLRHAHATMYTELGASTKETMAQLGHVDPKAALKYQHASQRRAQVMARRLSGLPDTPTDNTPNAVPLTG